MQTYITLADGFEEIEAMAVIDILRRAQIESVLVSMNGKLDVTGAHNVIVKADTLFENTNFSKGAMIILPGGGQGTKNLSEHAGLSKVLMEYASSQKWLCAICAAPSVFGKLGLLEGKTATCYPGFEPELKGARHSSAGVVMDGRFITSRGPGTVFEFALKIVEILRTQDVANELRSGMLI